MSNKPKKSSNRFLKLAGMTATIATKAVGNGIRNINANESTKVENRSKLMQEVGLQIADTLGEMKGAVMKVGQIAAQYKDIFPPEVAKSLEKLQQDAPPMPFEQIKKQIEKELGQPVNTAYKEFEETAFAAASIGQVHRAVLPTREKVVVKVQYPDVDKSCDSDLKQVRIALRLAGILKIDKKLQEAIFDEIKESLYDELDYTKEAHNLQVFKTFHAELDSGLIIPTVYPTHSSRRILTLSEETGETLSTASEWSEDIKSIIAHRLFNMSAAQVFKLRKIHCDPHAGNFAFRPNGDVVVYDFGCTRTYNQDDVNIFKSLVLHASRNDVTALESDLRQLDIRCEDNQTIPGEFYQEWIDIIKPALYENADYDFAQSDIHIKSVKKIKSSMKYWDNFKPSAKTMMLDRTINGIYWNIVNLKAKANFSSNLAHYIH